MDNKECCTCSEGPRSSRPEPGFKDASEPLHPPPLSYRVEDQDEPEGGMKCYICHIARQVEKVLE